MCEKLSLRAVMLKVQFLVVLVTVTSLSPSLAMNKCDRTPEGTTSGKSPADGRFRLKIVNDPVYYTPGETYKLSIEGVNRFSSISMQKFVGFFLTVEGEPERSDDELDLGRFSIVYPALSKLSEKCQDLVVNTNSVPKSEVQIEWTAPSSGQGCITFKSTIIEHRDVWFMDDGALTKKLCEDEAESVDLEGIIPECTACDEAKYELTFEGLWSRNTHPKDFPDDGWRTKFSDIIGASHSIGNHFWRYGQESTEGMKMLAEYGATGKLEEELKAKGSDVRTIIKARGISYPNVNGKTFAVFRVDSSRHLVSLVSKLYPSPDWFVGVSDLELCQTNGHWIDNRTINLYPFDAGTDSGATYTASDQPTIPQEAIRRIKPNNPNDPRSPFYDPENKEMKPLARLFIKRQRLYAKNCDSSVPEDENDDFGGYQRENDNDEEEKQVSHVDNTDYCEVGKWGEWEQCSNSCGKGTSIRRRTFIHSIMSEKYGCRAKLEEMKECRGTEGCSRNNNNNFRQEAIDRDEDDGDNQDNEDDDDDDDSIRDPLCKVTKWIDDSCSCENGKSRKRMHRTFLNMQKRKYCLKTYRNIVLEKYEDCPTTDCDADGETTARPIGINCPESKLHPWSRWSPCTADEDEGMGIQIRVRVPRERNLNTDENLQRIVNMYERLRNNYNQKKYENYDTALTLNVTTAADVDHVCFGVQLVESRICGTPNSEYDDRAENRCFLPPIIKKCSDTYEPHFYYNYQMKRCGIFLRFFGDNCQQTRNDFETYEECNKTCYGVEPMENRDNLRSNSLTSFALVQERVDCKMTPWEYTACNTTCGQGFRWKFRSIAIHPQNGGKPCPRYDRKLEKCKATDCDVLPRTQHAYYYPTRIVTTTRATTPYCEYSEWSAWSPCSKSCGQTAVQIRTRSLVNIENSALCTDRLEQRKCMVMPCLMQNYNYRQPSGYN